MKRLKKFLVLMLCLLLVFTGTTFAFCNCNNENENNQNAIDGVHKQELVKTNDYLIKNGATEFLLVTPSGSLCEELKVAKQEFIYIFKLATGITISAVTDDGLTLTENSKYISLGRTSLYNDIVKNDLSKAVSYEEFSTGYKIFNNGKSIFLVGGNDLGTAYSVYKFMELTFNYQSYASNCIVIDKNVKDKALYSYDVKDIPDIKYVSSTYGIFKDADTYDQRMFKYRMRVAVPNHNRTFWLFRSDDVNYARAAAQGAHTSLTLVPIDAFGKTHPKWFSDRSGGIQTTSQICYTAHGDKAEYQGLLEQTVASITHSLKRVPTSQDAYQVAINIGDEDNSNHCDCAKCKSLIDKYGARSALEILFLNDVIPLVEEWMNKPENAEFKRENLKYCFLIYNETEPAPATYNAKTKEYEINGGLVINEKITPILCCATYTDFRQSLYSETNKEQLKVFDAWQDICSEFAFWTYSTAFRSISYFYDSFSCFNNDMYSRIAKFNTWYYYNESQGGTTGALTGFHHLKLYLESKLAWDCSLNQEVLINNYFNAMYKDGASIMKEIYYTERVIADNAATELDLYKTEQVLTKLDVPRAYDLATLLQLLDKYEEAYEQIEKYKDVDLELYNNIHYHISQEWISPVVMIMDMFYKDLTVESAQELLNKFKRVYQETKISTVINDSTTEEWLALKEEELNQR